MHSTDRLLRALEHAPVRPFSGFVYRIIAERHRDSPLSAIGSVRSGGRYNPPNTFPVLYCADSQMTALLEVEALFTTSDGQLKGSPRDPDLVLSLRCDLVRVLDLTDDAFLGELGTSQEELVSLTPSRFILNARGEETPTQILGAACSFSGSISALKVPSAANGHGHCLNILPDSLLSGEQIMILDDSGRIKAQIDGVIPPPKRLG
ncbi:RES family NAD+ phosphorylase [Terriglobus sp. RCC_193]|uniref:RES family NAD+ phosphorylase n=1 Tax=Terriglobus sp. RCC_193 TaxID=3239218 RepID=UPI0035237CEF